MRGGGKKEETSACDNSSIFPASAKRLTMIADNQLDAGATCGLARFNRHETVGIDFP